MAEISSEQRSIEAATMRKVGIRLVPFLIVCYFIAYVDRVNVGFAALTMNKDLGLSAAAFGFGASLFFIAYVLFEVPSNLALERFGARRWIARIMISWGLVGIGSAFVTGAVTFSIARFLLGAAEAGFFPGVILYLTYWFPKAYRARIFGAFAVGIPVSLAIGAPLSTSIMQLDGLLGLKGWQWLFLLEGVPTTLFGFVFLALIPDRPKDATWLAPADRTALQSVIDAEQHGRQALEEKEPLPVAQSESTV